MNLCNIPTPFFVRSQKFTRLCMQIQTRMLQLIYCNSCWLLLAIRDSDVIRSALCSSIQFQLHWTKCYVPLLTTRDQLPHCTPFYKHHPLSNLAVLSEQQQSLLYRISYVEQHFLIATYFFLCSSPARSTFKMDSMQHLHHNPEPLYTWTKLAILENNHEILMKRMFCRLLPVG